MHIYRIRALLQRREERKMRGEGRKKQERATRPYIAHLHLFYQLRIFQVSYKEREPERQRQKEGRERKGDRTAGKEAGKGGMGNVKRGRKVGTRESEARHSSL